MNHYRTFCFLCFLAINLTLLAQRSGIEFNSGDWEEIKATALKENKPIFVDAYTDWCVPCKKMDQEVFSDHQVGEIYNKQFINVKMNMEKEPGKKLAAEYNVMFYPTLLYVSADGTLLHRVSGFQSASQILEVADVALDPSRRLAALDAKYAAGERNPDFLKMYAKARLDARDGSHTEIAEAYLETQDEWLTTANMNFIFFFTTNTRTKLFDHILEHRDRYYEMFGQREVTTRIQDLIYGAIRDTKEESSLDQVDRLYAKVYPDKAEELSAKFRMSFYRQAGDMDKYAESAVRYIEQFNPGFEELNDIAFTFYDEIEDKRLLKKALKWTKKSIKEEDNYYNHDTLAALYFKMNKIGKAKKAARQAIAIAKAHGMDYRQTEELLEEIEFGDESAEN